LQQHTGRKLVGMYPTTTTTTTPTTTTTLIYSLLHKKAFYAVEVK
jgi:hypothetical protein